MSDRERLQTTIVGPSGNIQARIVFIGEAPGKEENESGRPFVGSAGQLLRRCLTDKGIAVNDVLLHNVFQQRPPENDVHYYFNDKMCKSPTWEAKEHIGALETWLTELRDDGFVNVVVALGAIPLKVLTGNNKISRWRGSVLPCKLVPGLKIYPTFHPSYVNRSMHEPRERLMGEKKRRMQNALPLFLADLERIIEQAEFPEIRRPQRTFEIDLPFSQIINRLEQLHNYPRVAVDIETLPGQDGEGPILWWIGFSHKPSYGFSIPIVQKMHPAWPIEQEAVIHQKISELFLNSNVTKVFQNGSYDLCVLGRYYGYRIAKDTWDDTQWCHHASYPYLYKALHILASIYTWEPYYKDEGKHLGSRSDSAEGRYNAKDCCITQEIMPVVESHAKELNTWDGYLRSMRVQPSLVAMMINGVRIDMEKKAELARNLRHTVQFHEQEIFRSIGKTINLNSSSQVQAYLYGELGLKIQINMRTKQASVDKDAIQRLRKMYPSLEILEHLIERSKINKLLTQYAEMEIEPDGRIRTSYGFISTFRLSSSVSHFGGGGNLQNIPTRTAEGKEVRKLFIADKISAPPPKSWEAIIDEIAEIAGSEVATAYAACPERRQLLFARDLSQAEAQIVAWEAGDKARMQLFRNGWDVHWHNAKLLFGIPDEVSYSPETEKDEFADSITGQYHTLKELRNIGKTVVHAGNYGMGPGMLQTILARQGFMLDFMTCRKLLAKHIARNPLLVEWQRGIRQKVQAERKLTSSYGRIRYFMGRMGTSLYNSAYAFSPQNTVGEMLEESIQDIWETVPECTPLLNVHDEVVGQCNPWDLRTVLRKTKPCMERPLVINGEPLLIASDAKVGVSWGDLVEIKEPT